MLDVYAAAIETNIHRCAVVVTHSLNTVQLSPHTGYVEGEITFIDGSRLVFFEFLRQTATHLDREKYRYHFMDVHNQLIFRYDDAPHYPGVATSPHHKHLPTGVTDSSGPHFAEVLAEIEAHVLKIP